MKDIKSLSFNLSIKSYQLAERLISVNPCYIIILSHCRQSSLCHSSIVVILILFVKLYFMIFYLF